jgi:AcrR family transcriptional regulator
MQQRSEETRLKILNTAEDLFARQGYDATGVAEVCQAAGVSKGAFYHHFATKQAVFQALLTSWLAQLDQQLDQILSASQDIPSALGAMAESTGPVFEAASSHIRIILEFWIQAGRQPEIWETTVAPYQRYLERFTSLIDQAAHDGSLAPEVDPRAAARLVLALAMGMLLQSFLDPQGEVWSQVTREGMRTIIAGMTRNKP